MLLALAGILAPYARAGDSADQRFYVMIALAPLALAGLLLAWSNRPWRTSAGVAHAPKLRAHKQTDRPQNASATSASIYNKLLPISLGILFAAVLVVVVTVVLPALLALMR